MGSRGQSGWAVQAAGGRRSARFGALGAVRSHAMRRHARVTVELTDFSVFYSQGLSESITAELKAGKSEVIREGSS